MLPTQVILPLWRSDLLVQPKLTARTVSVPVRFPMSSTLTHVLVRGHLSNTFPDTCRPAQLCKLLCNQPAKAGGRRTHISRPLDSRQLFLL